MLKKRYDFFLMIYERAVKKYFPFYQVKEIGERKWHNGKCDRAKEERDRAWMRLESKLKQKTKEEYKLASNEYVKIRIEEEKRYEKDIVDKCMEEPKLFYRFINGQLKHKESIVGLKENKEVH